MDTRSKMEDRNWVKPDGRDIVSRMSGGWTVDRELRLCYGKRAQEVL